MHWAVNNRDTAMTEFLLQHGASLEAKDTLRPGSPVGGVMGDGEACRVAPLTTFSARQVFRGEQRVLNPTQISPGHFCKLTSGNMNQEKE